MKRRTQLNTYKEDSNKRVKSIRHVLDTQRNILQETELIFCSEFGVALRMWHAFVSFCSRLMVYKRILNASFHACIKQSLKHHKIELRYASNANRSKIKQSHSPKKIEEDMWIEIFILMDGIGGYKMYKLLQTEFHFVMMSLFSTFTYWMTHNEMVNSETVIPSVLLRGCLRYFGRELVLKLFPDIKPFLLELQPCLHEAIDIFKMVQLYGDHTTNALVKNSEQTEDDYETNSDTEAEADVVSTAYAESGASADVLSSLSSLYSKTPSISANGHVERTIPEKKKLFSSYFYMELPMERVKRDKEELAIHPYDLGLYAFVEAKRNGNSLYESYKKVVQQLKNDSNQDKVVEQLNQLKTYIFGKGEFNLAHIIMAEKIVSMPKTSLDVTRLFYTAEVKEESTHLVFNRATTMTLDVVLALKYLNVKYRRMFQLDISNAIHWDSNIIRVTMDNTQYKTLTDSILFFESFMARSDYCVPLYPVLAQRYLSGTPAEAEQCVKIILKLIRETRFSTRESSRWVSNANDEEIEYLKLLPKIIQRYNSYSFLWSRLVYPYSHRMGMKFGPSERWAREQSLNENNAMKFTEKQKYGKNKVNWGLSGFNGELGGNIYMGLESFFAIRTRHIINYFSLKRLYSYIKTQSWFQTAYPELSNTLDLIMDGTVIPEIIFYGDQDLVELPFTVDGSKFTKVMNNNQLPSLWDYVHVQLFKLCADTRFNVSYAIDIFENLIMRNNVLTQAEGNKKSIAISNFSFLLPQMTTVRDMVTDDLKEKGYFQSDYELDIEEDNESLERPNEIDFFAFLLESLERLSFYHTDITRVTEPVQEEEEGELEEEPKEGDEVVEEKVTPFISPENVDYRGSQRRLPRAQSRWLPFNNRLIRDKHLNDLPIFYDKETFKPVYSNSFIPTMWTISYKYTGSRKLIRNSLRQKSEITSFMFADPDLINCLVCYPPSQL